MTDGGRRWVALDRREIGEVLNPGELFPDDSAKAPEVPPEGEPTKPRRNLFKLIVGKIPLFIGLIVFIQLYTALVGQENVTIGIALITTLLMMLGGSLGYEVRRAAVMIPVMLLVAAIAPVVAALNPAIGFIVNLLAILFILVFSTLDIRSGNQVPFLLLYIFAMGYPVSGDLLTRRWLSVLVCGVAIGLVYYLVHRRDASAAQPAPAEPASAQPASAASAQRTFGDLFHQLTFFSPQVQWYSCLAVTLAVSMLLGALTDYPRTMWVSFVVLSLIYPEEGEVRHRLKHRIPATIVGSVLFFVVFTYVIPANLMPLVSVVVGFSMMFLTQYPVKTVANSFSAMFLAATLLSTEGAVEVRIISAIAGVALVLVSFLVFRYLYRWIDARHERAADR